MTKNVFRNFLTAALICLIFSPIYAYQKSDSSAQADLSALIKKINDKLSNGDQSKEALAQEIKEFDSLISKYKDLKTDNVAEILLWKGKLFQEVFRDEETAHRTYMQLKNEYPDSSVVEEADVLLISLQLRVGAEFPDFQVEDIEGKSLSLAQYTNKVVLIDFWATWCPPCLEEMPAIIKTYKEYKNKGFEIIGISLDRNEDKLKKFVKDNGMTWRQYFDGSSGPDSLSRRYSIDSIPSTFLLDADGKIIAKNLRGAALKDAIKDAVSRL